jgi:3-oxoadipate enol-lactonase
VNGLSYLRRGAGEPLLLIQGMAGHHRFWGEWLLGALDPHFDLVAYDHRGIGRSPRADEPFTIADLADDAAELIAELGWSSAHVLGISLGGMVAQELALRHPAAVRTLTIGCSAPSRPAGVTPSTPERMAEAAASGDVDPLLRMGFERNLSPAFTADPDNFERYRELSLAVKVPVPVVLMQYEAARRHDTVDRLSGIGAPTLVIHGTGDEVIPVANGQRLAEAIPGARLELFDGVGHLFWWEEPDRTVRLVLDHTGVR